MTFPSQTFVDKQTVVLTPWYQAVNDFCSTFPNPVGNAGKVVSSDGAGFVLTTPGVGTTNYVTAASFGAVGDGVTDDTAAIQAAVDACINVRALMFTKGTYLISSTIVIRGEIEFFGEGALVSQLKYTGAGVPLQVAPAVGVGIRFLYIHDIGLYPSVNGAGTGGLTFTLQPEGASFCYVSNFTITRCFIGDFGGYGLVLDNTVGNLNSFFTGTVFRNWITNGIDAIKPNDSVNFEQNTITDGPTVQAAKTGGRIGFLYTGLVGARQIVFRCNNVTTSGGWIAGINCEQLRIENNQLEHPSYYFIPYYANDPTGAGVYGAGMYLYNSYAGRVVGNTCGTGSTTTTTASGTTSIGFPTVTGMSSTTNIYRGCTVRGTGIPANTRVSSVVGTTITLTNNATANGTPSLTFGYAADTAIFLDGGTIKTDLTSNDVTSGTYWHYTISNGCYDNNTYGNSTYAGVSTTAVINDQSTGTQYNNIEDPLWGYTQDPLFFNPFCDLWNGTDPTNTFGAGFTPGGAATAARDLVNVYTGNAAQVALAVVSNGTTILNGFDIVPATQPWRETGWISGCVAVRANSATVGKVIVFFVNGATVTQVGATTVAGSYQLIQFRCRITAGSNWAVRLATGNGSGTYATGWQFYLGGVNLVRGPSIPNNIQDSAARRTYVTTGGVGFAPPFIGARAFVNGTGKYYLAANSTVAADWIILN